MNFYTNIKHLLFSLESDLNNYWQFIMTLPFVNIDLNKSLVHNSNKKQAYML